ncbi:MAG: regulatory protein RecX [Woeseia sp.]|nr:recombination regulator RecX [Woeseia sp.]NNL54072.1 regulatory protein RecX [Woeseia sp.]
MSKSSSLHDEIKALQADGDEARFANPQEARKKAMDYLARREYGQAEIKKKLAGAGFTRDACERAVDQLTADGLQDDRRFADSFVQSRVNKGKGPLRIQLELSERGIAAELINDTLDDSGVDWRELARAVRHKKFGGELPRDFKEKARQMRFLQYRGFGPDQIQAGVGADGDFD